MSAREIFLLVAFVVLVVSIGHSLILAMYWCVEQAKERKRRRMDK